MSEAVAPDGLRILEAQLGRVRSMLYRYHELFFRFTGAGLVAVGALFSYVIFARTFVAALERRINREVGTELLVAHRLEEVYFGSPGDPRLVAASLRRPATFISAETWHFTVVGAGLFVVSVFLGSTTVQRVGEPWTTWYVPVVVGWALLNGAYLAWHFIARRDQRAIERILADAYEPSTEPETA